jgi:hypothetical protein
MCTGKIRATPATGKDELFETQLINLIGTSQYVSKIYEISSHEKVIKNSSLLINLEFVYKWLTSKNMQSASDCNSE